MMRSRSRTKLKILLLAAILCGLPIAVGLFSLYWRIEYTAGRHSVIVQGGCVVLNWGTENEYWIVPRGLWLVPCPQRSLHWRFARDKNVFRTSYFIPIWPFLIGGALVTLAVWWRSGRLLSGACKKCGYNLTGLQDARCPECGTAFDPSLLSTNGASQTRKPAGDDSGTPCRD